MGIACINLWVWAVGTSNTCHKPNYSNGSIDGESAEPFKPHISPVYSNLLSKMWEGFMGEPFVNYNFKYPLLEKWLCTFDFGTTTT